MNKDELMNMYFEAVHDISYWIGSSTNLALYYQGKANAIASVMLFVGIITIAVFKSMFLVLEDL